MKFGRSFAGNIDFEVANFRFLVKTRRKTLIFLSYNVSELEKLCARNARLMLSRVSLRVSGCAVSMREAAKRFV